MPDSKASTGASTADQPSTLQQTFTVSRERSGQRLDQFLAASIPEVSRTRVQQLIRQQDVLVNGRHQKASYALQAGDEIRVTGEVRLSAIRAEAENIPLEILYEDAFLAVLNKPAGMLVHAGAGATDEARNRGTLVNALLYHFKRLSHVGGELRPGIVHRLDKDTSGLIVVAKTDAAHRKLAAQFSGRSVRKTYLALVQGWPKLDQGTISSAISRDRIRRTRMTTRSRLGREAISHYQVLERMHTAWGKFSLLEVKIDTGRTHQIRVHLSSIGYPIVGDALYGAAREYKSQAKLRRSAKLLRPPRRNFLHAARLEFLHPQIAKRLCFEAPLPGELQGFLQTLRGSVAR